MSIVHTFINNNETEYHLLSGPTATESRQHALTPSLVKLLNHKQLRLQKRFNMNQLITLRNTDEKKQMSSFIPEDPSAAV